MIDTVVPARSFVPAFVVEAGEVLRIEDLAGRQAADVVLMPVDDPHDQMSCIYTQLLNRTTRITHGHVIYSKAARPLATVVEDTVGVHWFGGGCCSAETNEFRYGSPEGGSCRENLVESLAGHIAGPAELELDAIASLFMNIAIGPDGGLEIVLPTSRAGDHIDLRAERSLLVAVSACPQERNPCNGFEPSDIALSTSNP
ncbi:urea carboxylase-associated family protein [Nocardioides sp. LHD-245]|uniref:urea carboxylase-associated family protein n=1 Tax=Nocardioides sp. LHD-245 TaxID=3051387 RepID=UPI0027DEFE97|nr:urea carboxylase-associated family protein [Nocardioides sp. LHD-245]